jgi:hypothetical protein
MIYRALLVSLLLASALPVMTRAAEDDCPAGGFRDDDEGAGECVKRLTPPPLVPAATARERKTRTCLAACIDKVQACVKNCGGDLGCNTGCSDDRHAACQKSCRRN